MVDNKPSAVESAVGESGGKVAAATPQADDTRALAIALGTTRSTINALRTPMNREKTAHTTANALRTPTDREQAAHTTAKRAQGAACSHGPVRLSLRAGSVGRRLHKKCLQNGSQSRGYSACFALKRRERFSAFTLAELLVSVFVLVLLVFLFTQLLNSAATITILGLKRMDADSEARQVLDRMAIDFAQMVKRTDVNYYVKVGFNNKNDQIAFYSAVPGYYPSSGAQSPVSLVAYRVNSDSTSPSYNKLERLGKGLVWNGVSTTDTPVVFMPLIISATWPAATSSSASDTAYEVIGPDVFRFEYYYKLTAGFTTDGLPANGWRGVAAIVVGIALIDPKSKVLLTDQDIGTLNGNPTAGTSFLKDFSSDPQPGKLLNKWQTQVNTNTTLRRQALSGVRVYERYFYLNQ